MGHEDQTRESRLCHARAEDRKGQAHRLGRQVPQAKQRSKKTLERIPPPFHENSCICENLAFSFLKVFATLGGGGSLTLWKYKYPAQRVSKQEDGTEVGVAGTMDKLQESQIADQPISGTKLIKLMCRKGFSIGSSSSHFSKLTVFFSKICTFKI